MTKVCCASKAVVAMRRSASGSGALHHLIGEGKPEAGLAQERECGLLSSRLLGFQAPQQFVPCDDRESQPFVLGKICQHPLHDKRVLLEQLGEKIGIEKDSAMGAGDQEWVGRSQAVAWSAPATVRIGARTY